MVGLKFNFVLVFVFHFDLGMERMFHRKIIETELICHVVSFSIHASNEHSRNVLL